MQPLFTTVKNWGTRPFLLFFSIISFSNYSYGQLCNGSRGDPVVNITFGSGTGTGQPLNSSLTNYSFVSNNCPGDGSYTVTNSTTNCFGNTWHSLMEDHTPNDTSGYMMVVNASFTPGDFYVETVTGLCGGTTYEFAAWILNILKSSSCGGNGIQPNVTFNIETTSGTVLLSNKTGNISSVSSPQWNQYGAFFKTPDNVTSVVIRMTNNAPGGCGNDLALDDITFRPCGAKVEAGINGSSSPIHQGVCVGDTSTIILNGNYAGTENVGYQWQVSKNNGALWSDIPGANSVNYRWLRETAAGIYLYRLAIAQPSNINTVNCRTLSNVITINVNSTPVPSATNNGPKCEGEDLVLSTAEGFTYAWTGPGNFSSASRSPVISNISLSTGGKYYVTVTSNKGCTSKDSTIVNIKTKPNAAFNAVSSACAQQGVQFNDASSSAITSWRWDFKDGQSSSSSNPLHVFLNDGTFSVSLIITNNEGCTDTAIKDIIIDPLPVVKFALPGVCEGVQGRFVDSSTIRNGTEREFMYLWNFGDNSSSTDKNPFKTYNSGGNYTVNLAVTSNRGCKNSSTKNLTVSSIPIADFSVSGQEICSNVSIILTDNSNIAFGKISNTKIYWHWPGITDTTSDLSPAAGKQYQKSYTPFGSPATKDFIIKYETDNGVGCVSSRLDTITLKASPLLLFDTVPIFCINESATLITTASETSGITGSGIYTGPGINSFGLFTPALAGAGNHLILYNYTASNGCSSLISRTITVEALPQITAGPDKFLLEGSTVTLQGSTTSTNLIYKWTPPGWVK
jgi:PKD repeat protein